MTHPGRTALRIAKWTMLVAFTLSVVVQLNDPDPLPWAAIYGAAAAACLLDLKGRGRWWMPAGIGVLALVWGLTLAPGVLGQVPFGSMFGAWEMENVGVERSREMYGLFLIAAWMAVLIAARARSRDERVGADHTSGTKGS